jgi:hypothetical protein
MTGQVGSGQVKPDLLPSLVGATEPVPELLRIISETCSQLHRLAMLSPCYLGPALDNARAPNLLPFHVDGAEKRQPPQIQMGHG